MESLVESWSSPVARREFQVLFAPLSELLGEWNSFALFVSSLGKLMGLLSKFNPLSALISEGRHSFSVSCQHTVLELVKPANHSRG